MARKRAIDDYAEDADYQLDEMGLDSYGSCPICMRKFDSPTGFECDSCGVSVCGRCIHAYGENFICASCVAQLPKKEQAKVGSAKALVEPAGARFSRSAMRWLLMLFILTPVLLGAAYFFYSAGSTALAIGAVILVLVLIFYWDRQMYRMI